MHNNVSRIIECQALHITSFAQEFEVGSWQLNGNKKVKKTN